MRIFPFFLIALAIAVCASHRAFAWGKRGHNIVAEIAFHELSAPDKEKILSYLGSMTIEEASTWLDEVRQTSQYAYTAPWHYVNFPKGTRYQPTDQPNIVNAITHAIDELNGGKGLTDEQIRFDLLTLIHLIGDLHQPLHVGYADDKGGNDYQVSYLGKGSNLHRVWDSEIIENRNITLPPCLKMAQNFTPDERRLMMEKVDVLDWVQFNHTMAAVVYPEGHKIDSNYVINVVPVIEHQLAVAGVRLSSVLHEVAQHLPLSKPGTQPAEGAKEVSLDSLASHIGETVHVCGKVYGVTYLATGSKPTFVNVGAAYPNSPLTLFIASEVRDSFSYKPEEKLKGKDICIIGRLELYKSKPEIVIKKETDIVIKK